jgi:phosphoribosylformylglycinamidine synthase subunit PurQ / glutaminase
MSLDVAIVLFPGTNCELDVAYAVDRLGGTPTIVFHTERDLGGADAVIVPGGFAHGDYLRTGAIARFAPVMDAVAAFASDGGPVVGICNGFQVLTEAQLLPGALQKNAGLRFLCTTVEVEIASTRSALTSGAAVGDVLRLPINHFEGNYTCDAATLERLRDGDCVVARYVDNPNGSLDDIAGISNEAGNVVGLMPHPERAVEAILGSDDGAVLLRSLLAAAADRKGERDSLVDAASGVSSGGGRARRPPPALSRG